VADPFGHEWQLATHTEDLSPDEIAERGRKAMDGPS
jgi:PhnB protein